MGLFDKAAENIKSVFSVQEPEPPYFPKNAYTMNAYAIAGMEEEASFPTFSGFNQNKDAVAQSAVSADKHSFENGTSVESFTDKEGNSRTFVNTANGKSYSTGARSDKDFKVSFNSDGSYTQRDRQNKSHLTVSVAGNSFYYDASNFTPSVPVTKTTESKVQFTIGEDGKVSVNGVNGARGGEAFIKGKDNGIRTITPNGQLVLADPNSLPKDIPRADRAAHKAFLKQVEKNPELAEMQGVAPKPRAPVQQPMQPQPAQQQPMQPAQPSQAAQPQPTPPSQQHSLGSLGDSVKKAAAAEMQALLKGGNINAQQPTQGQQQQPPRAPSVPNVAAPGQQTGRGM